MKTFTASTLIASFALVAGIAAAPSASAQARLWNFGDQSNPGACSQTAAGGTNGIGNVYSCAAQGSSTITMEARAYGLTATSSMGGHIGYHGTTSGIGVGNANEGGSTASSSDNSHAFDNGGTTDVLLLKFTTGPVALQTLDIGYYAGDSDVSVLRWTGSGDPTGLASTNLSNMTGWTSVANIANAEAFNPATFNAGALTSSYWLIAAYNTAFGGTGFDTTQDNFKLLSVGTNRVGEPASLALAGLALTTGWVSRRRRVAAKR